MLVLRLIACLLFLSHFSLAQGGFSREVSRKTGDLNKDNREDLVIVLQDTSDDSRPYLLQIFFKQPDGRYKLAIATEKAIDAAYPGGYNGYSSGDDFDDITIVNGILTVSVQLLRGHYEHKFRYQNGNFELIGFSSTGSDGQGTSYLVDFNLSTGMRFEKDERYDTTLVLRDIRKRVMIRPLPRLQEFEPLQSELY